MNIKVIKAGKEFVFQGKTNFSLLEQLREQNIYMNAVCSGKGSCGKCRIQMLSGVTEPDDIEHQFFDKKELAAGFRLACRTFPQNDCSIIVETFEETAFQAVAEYFVEKKANMSENIYTQSMSENFRQRKSCDIQQELVYTQPISEEVYVIAIDLGTTTIAMELIEKNTGHILHTLTMLNRQRMYGADVVSRIQAANAGKGKELQDSICEDLYQGIKKLIKEYKVNPQTVKEIGIAGNTTMGHLLMGYSCKTLGVYPFTPVNIETIAKEFRELFWKQQQNEGMAALDIEAKVILLPGISAYVGADIVAGILACHIDKKEKPCMLIDLGTNGEMVIGNREKILVTSVAAGPAFEGGNISCGMGSVLGAIHKVSLEAGQIQLETIGNKGPLGLCGTGVIETVCELLKEKIVDETGMFSEEFIEDGFLLEKTLDGKELRFTQKDVREIQLAKSAVRAGIETLLKHYDTTYEEIDEVFLAGGFGYEINIEKTMAIGMLPKEFQGKIKIVGNSSLGGTTKYLIEADAIERCQEMRKKVQEVELSLDTNFTDCYMKYMFFGNYSE